MSQLASTSESAPAAHSPPPRRRRWWFPLATLALVAVALVAISQLPPEQFDSGMRTIFSFLIAVIGAVAIGCWFFFMAGVTANIRIAVGVCLVLLAAGTIGATRRVEFSGDMVPTFDFRWMPDRESVLEDYHRRESSTEQPPLVLRPSEDNVLEFRGPKRDGISPGPALARDWSREQPKLVWRHPVGGGYASFVVVEPLAITIEQRRDREAIVAYDVDTGQERWVHDYPALFHETLGGDGPRATPTIHEDKVYSLGATGMLVCLDVATGKPHWSLNLLEKNGVANLEWAMSGSPLVYDGLVVVNPGDQKGTTASRALLALDAASGQLRFGGGAAEASYASPMLVTLGGVRQVLGFDAVGLVGYDATDARELWRFPWKSDFDINAAQPVVLDDERVLITSQTGAAVIKIARVDDLWSAESQWTSRRLKASYASPIVYKNHVYGIDENILACIELETGRQVWKDRRGQYGHGQLLLRGDLLVIQAESGELALVEANSERFHECAIIQAINGKTWNNPTLFGRSILARNHLEMARYDLPTD